MIRISEVVTILDAGVRRPSATLLPFLDKARKQGRLERISDIDEIKSYVVTETTIYASPISSLTLLKRARQEGNIPSG